MSRRPEIRSFVIRAKSCSTSLNFTPLIPFSLSLLACAPLNLDKTRARAMSENSIKRIAKESESFAADRLSHFPRTRYGVVRLYIVTLSSARGKSIRGINPLYFGSQAALSDFRVVSKLDAFCFWGDYNGEQKFLF